MKTKAILAGLFFTIIGGWFEMSPTTQASDDMPTVKLSSDSETVQTKSSCNIRAYLNDPDKSGTNIRSKPDKNSSVVKVVKTENEMVAKITGSSNGWFEISVIEEWGGDADRNLFEGRGWIHSSLLGIDVAGGDHRLYAQSSKKSRALMKLVVDQTPLTIIACKGNWAQVKSGKLTGWLPAEAQCANPLTTCS